MQLNWRQLVLVWLLTVIIGSVNLPILLDSNFSLLTTDQFLGYIQLVGFISIFSGIFSIPALFAQIFFNTLLIEAKIKRMKYRVMWVIFLVFSFCMSVFVFSLFIGGTISNFTGLFWLFGLYYAVGVIVFFLFSLYLERKKLGKRKNQLKDIVYDSI